MPYCYNSCIIKPITLIFGVKFQQRPQHAAFPTSTTHADSTVFLKKSKEKQKKYLEFARPFLQVFLI